MNGHPVSSYKYTQLRDTLFEKIRRSEYPLHSKLPRVVDISKQYGVSYVTAQRAVSSLADSGILTQTRRAGATVIRTTMPEIPRALAVGCMFRPLRAWNDQDNYGLRVIETVCRELSVHHASATHFPLPMVEASAVDRLRCAVRTREVAAVLLDQLVPDNAVTDLARCGLPIAMFGRHPKPPAVDSVAPDMEWMGREVGRRIIEQRYDRVVIIHMPRPEYHGEPHMQVRILPVLAYVGAIERTLAEAGFARQQVVLAYEPPQEESHLWVDDNYFCRSQHVADRPDGTRTAYVTYRDVIGVRTAHVLRARGYVLPRDAGVLGQFNLECNRHPPTAVTTWEINPEEIGRDTVELLLDRLRNPSREGRRRSLRPAWVDRGTF